MCNNLIIAKCNQSLVTETLQEHTENLLKKVDEIKNIYSKDIERLSSDEIWNKLKYACLFHDLGKVSEHFQAKIRKVAKLSFNKTQGVEIPHNYLSPAFFTLLDFDDLESNDSNFFTKLFYTVSYHHNRELKNFDERYLNKIIKDDLSKKLHHLKWLEKYNVEIKTDTELMYNYYNQLEERYSDYQNIKRNKEYILMKGLFHRIDHCASGHITIEEERIQEPKEKLLNHLLKKSEEKAQELGIENLSTKDNILKDFQKDVENLRDKNILLQASTGMGKTEFALNWIGEDKAFYVLPLKVSVNAIYERFCSIFCSETKDKIGLLHGDSMLYGISDDDPELKEMFKDDLNTSTLSEDSLSIQEHIKRIDISRQFAMPLNVSTADQLFTSVFKWKGYEKIYATLMYSKIVIDEPQSYSPDMLAMIIKCLEELSNLGAKFCLMSATIHPKVKEKLKDICYIPEPVYNQEPKHKIKIIDESINNVKEIIESNYDEYIKNNKKILIICNTVKRSQEVYQELKNFGNVHLLHSCFIQKDRKEKEAEYKKDENEKDKEKNINTNSIMKDCKKNEFVIWISTQIVEASLDIDYDILFTETASIDALIQRMGRVFRKNDVGRIINLDDEANINIFIKEPSGINFKAPSEKNLGIYDKDICLKTIEVLHERNEQIILDVEKQELMDKVYNPESARNFDKEFARIYYLLNAGLEATNKTEAQSLFRDVLSTSVIPESIYNENMEKIDNAVNIINGNIDKNLTPKEKQAIRLKSIKTLNDYSISLPTYKYHKKEKTSGSMGLPLNKKYFHKGLFILNADYNSEIGLILDKELEAYSVHL